MRDLKKLLAKQPVVGIEGPGGSGKSYLAVELARELKYKYKLRVGLALKLGVVNELNSLWREMEEGKVNYPRELLGDFEELGSRVRRNLDALGSYVLILDGAEEAGEFIKGFLREGKLLKGKLIMTSRVAIDEVDVWWRMRPLSR